MKDIKKWTDWDMDCRYADGLRSGIIKMDMNKNMLKNKIDISWKVFFLIFYGIGIIADMILMLFGKPPIFLISLHF